MSKQMLVSIDWETRIAFLNDNALEEIHIEHSGLKREQKGNIYKGIVEQIQPSINAAFINIGLEKNAFLSLDSIDFSVHKPNSKKEQISIQSLLEEKQEVIVQVTKDATPSKGAYLTTFISIPGRYLVFAPSPSMHGVSKRIVSVREKTRLNKFIEAVADDDKGYSIIVRTAAVSVPTEELKQEYLQLKKQWEEIVENNKKHAKPTLLMKERPFIFKIIRDYYTKDIEEIYVDDKNTMESIKEFLNEHSESSKLHFYSERMPLFNYFNVEQSIQQLSDRKVILPSGAYLVIDQTEALVAIDVNSGSAKSSGGVENMIFHINIEAAQEAARQIRLRNLSGLVVIDFIDMQSRDQRREIEDTLKLHFQRDKAQHTIHSISRLGLLELSRQKLGKNLPGSGFANCPSCKGLGKVVSLDSQIYKILRQIKIKAQRNDFLEFTIYISSHLNEAIQKDKIDLFRDLEKEYSIKIKIEEEAGFELCDEAEIVALRDKSKPLAIEEEEEEMIAQPEFIKKPMSRVQSKKLDISEQEKTRILSDFAKSKNDKKENNLEKTGIHKKYLWKKLVPPATSEALTSHSMYKPRDTRNKTPRKPGGFNNHTRQRTAPPNFSPRHGGDQKEGIFKKIFTKFLGGNSPEPKVENTVQETQNYAVRKEGSFYKSKGNYSHSGYKRNRPKPPYNKEHRSHDSYNKEHRSNSPRNERSDFSNSSRYEGERKFHRRPKNQRVNRYNNSESFS
jgi:Rne/Rng family ribonuclease